MSGGFRTSEEDGELYGAGALAAFEAGSSVWRLKGEYFQGTVDAKGVSSGVAWATDASVLGFRAEGDLGWRFRAGAASLVPNLGFGYRWWRRDYRSSATVIGLQEEWQAGNVKVGAVARYEAGRTVTLFLEAAGRLGVFASDRITYNGARVTMKPGGRVTPYAEAGLAAGVLKGSVYYERIEFSQSDPVAAPGLPPGTGLVQPETTADIYGARVGLSF